MFLLREMKLISGTGTANTSIKTSSVTGVIDPAEIRLTRVNRMPAAVPATEIRVFAFTARYI
ncbi:MAG: hypothetical protein IJJ22_05210, partial [Oscillospiraceae bacterium]|nr:hypothetical protein [Oscillospiraceae bacterium]